MAVTKSTMLPLGTSAPEFSLPDCTGGTVALDDFASAPALLVMFICNHCPFVQHVRGELANLAREYQEKGVAVVAINANDIDAYPEDSPEKMAEAAETYGYTFPYLYDESQEAAMAYQAACTPDFFVFDAARELAYRGQLDDSRPGNGKPITGKNLRAALDAVLDGKPAPAHQVPSIGCNIKWRKDNVPAETAV